LDVIGPGRLRSLGVAPPAAVDTGQAVAGHQTGDLPSTDVMGSAQNKLGMNAPDSIGRPGRGVDLDDHVEQIGIGDITVRRWPLDPLVITRRRNSQDPARHRHGKPVSGKLTNEPEPYFGSTFSRAK
jgi:hypothetical protein